MIGRKRADEIYTAFYMMLQTTDISKTDVIPIDELEKTLLVYHRESNLAPYKAMEKRIADLKEIEARKITRREKWIDRIIGAVFGLIVSYILYLITKP